MSHWTSVKTKIKDFSALEVAAKELGVKVTKGNNLKLTSLYQPTQDAEMLFEYKGGLAGVIKDENGDFTLTIDNFGNPLVDKVGRDCAILGRGYSVKVVERQTMMMGGFILGNEMLEDGSLEMTIQV